VEEARQYSAVTGGSLVAVFAIAFGGFLAVYCSRAALAEFRSGVARGRVNSFRRERHPIAFWMTIGATLLAGIIGLAFVVFGVAALGTNADLIS
jgi:hypothetical protein